MLVTNKINLFSFFLGKRQAADKANARSKSKVQNLDNMNLNELDNRISITKSEDLYKANSVSMVNAFSQLNR
jgi:hypothetical protein